METEIEKSVVEGNKLIAEFMKHPYLKIWRKFNDVEPFDFNRLKYHLDWAWLHPVIKKIWQMKSDPSECFMGTTVDRHFNFSHVLNLPIYTKTEHAWQAVVNFIEWYNIQVAERNLKTNNQKQ